MRFSERNNLVKTLEIQKDGMTPKLRNTLWNTLDDQVWNPIDLYGSILIHLPRIEFCSKLWKDFFYLPADRIDNEYDTVRENYFKFEWHEVYDFVEFVLSYFKSKSLQQKINADLERNKSAYRYINFICTAITDINEIKIVEELLNDNTFRTVNEHIMQATKLFSDKNKPDYRNSIKESISAVESLCKLIADKPKATLGDALKVIEKSGKIHPALSQGFIKIYGYTNDADGIRHAMTEETDLTASDAKFFLLSCTNFINYLKTKIS
jgi:hypothetical protein